VGRNDEPAPPQPGEQQCDRGAWAAELLPAVDADQRTRRAAGEAVQDRDQTPRRTNADADDPISSSLRGLSEPVEQRRLAATMPAENRGTAALSGDSVEQFPEVEWLSFPIERFNATRRGVTSGKWIPNESLDGG
jgi:hypothetical protein